MASFKWANDPMPLSLTPKFIVPNENKPNLTSVSDLGDSIPTVDMDIDNEALINDISKACEEYGFFQLINHGISNELCHDVLQVITDFFHLPYEAKADLLSTTHMEDGKIFKYYIKDRETNEKIFMWSEAFFHCWDPIDDSYLQNLPCNPPSYREIVGDYINQVSSLIPKILCLISQALGLDKDYLQKRLGEKPQCTAQANYYPPCPDPEQTLGLRDHTDLKILTVLLADEGVPGLQVEKDDKWFAVNPKPGALIVNVADQLQVLSNDKYKSACHRVVNNKTKKRTTFGIFVGPEEHSKIGPIKELGGRPLYRDYTFQEFMQVFRNQEGQRRMVKEYFRKTDKGELSNQTLLSTPTVV
ncbi:hypothetical protein RND81_10G158800 [Saponaria officinalis]|uniref:Fe2OG dioxygenase domain-containing protein n=1 Tax=Saponaria officinalis TaxID=3572 RepID=A0AAW1I3V7_SAPOF